MDSLIPAMNQLMSSSLAANTMRLYQTAYNGYLSFCRFAGLHPLPITEYNLLFYVTSVANRLAYQSIKTYLAGIQYHSVRLGTPTNIANMSQLYYLLRGVRRTQGRSHSRPPRSPVTTANLQQLLLFIQTQDISSHDKRLLWAAITVAFFGLLRVSEYTSGHTTTYNRTNTLLRTDINFSPNFTHVAIVLRSSKTDPFRNGCCIRVGATANTLCPVSALWNFVRQSGYNSGPLFTYSDGSYLSRSRLSSLLTACFSDKNLNTHSLRIGGASAMATAGLPDSSIMVMGRWSSNAYQRYLRFPDAMIQETARKMSHSVVTARIWDSELLVSKNST